MAEVVSFVDVVATVVVAVDRCAANVIDCKTKKDGSGCFLVSETVENFDTSVRTSCDVCCFVSAAGPVVEIDDAAVYVIVKCVCKGRDRTAVNDAWFAIGTTGGMENVAASTIEVVVEYRLWTFKDEAVW